MTQVSFGMISLINSTNNGLGTWIDLGTGRALPKFISPRTARRGVGRRRGSRALLAGGTGRRQMAAAGDYRHSLDRVAYILPGLFCAARSLKATVTNAQRSAGRCSSSLIAGTGR